MLGRGVGPPGKVSTVPCVLSILLARTVIFSSLPLKVLSVPHSLAHQPGPAEGSMAVRVLTHQPFAAIFDAIPRSHCENPTAPPSMETSKSIRTCKRL